MDNFKYPGFIGNVEVREGGASAFAQNFSSLPPSARPRERLCQFGPEALSDHELLAILLNTGIQGKDVFRLAGELLERLDRDRGIPSIKDLTMLTGLGEGKACTVVAMLEFGRRRWTAGVRIRRPEDIHSLVRHYADRKQERFLCLSLNGAHEVLAIRVITVGLVNRTIVHPREVYAEAISDHAVAVIAAHNHPSGQLSPSPEDDEVTCRLRAAAGILGINFLDHVIFSKDSFFSYRQENRLGDGVGGKTQPQPA
jgi:DNA repair protein RadC